MTRNPANTCFHAASILFEAPVTAHGVEEAGHADATTRAGEEVEGQEVPELGLHALLGELGVEDVGVAPIADGVEVPLHLSRVG